MKTELKERNIQVLTVKEMTKLVGGKTKGDSIADIPLQSFDRAIQG